MRERSSGRSRTRSCSSSRACACRRPSSSSRPEPRASRRAVELGRGSLLAAALLVQLKTLLDNADGQLARLTGRTSAFGRYLDSEVDLARQRSALRRDSAGTSGQPGARRSPGSSRSRASSASTSTSSGSRARRRPSRTTGGRRDGGFCAGSTASSTRRRTGSRSALVARRPALTSSRARVSLLANLGMSTQLAVFGLLIVVRTPARLRLARARARSPSSRSPSSRGARPETGGNRMSNVFELPPTTRARPRPGRPPTGQRLERNAAEILAALGLDLDTPGTRDTPRRFVQALYDATAGYDGDPKLRTLFPAERPAGRRGTRTRRSSRARSASTRSASTTRCRSTAAPTSATSPATRSSASRSSRGSCGSTRGASRCRSGSPRRSPDGLQELTGARGVAVKLEAAHMCTAMRGVEEDGSVTVTTVWRGLYDEDESLRSRVPYADAVIEPFTRPRRGRRPAAVGRARRSSQRLYGGAIGLDEPCVVANFVESLDGVVAVPGLPRSHAVIGDDSEADRFVLALAARVRGRRRRRLGHAARVADRGRGAIDRAYPPAADALAELRARARPPEQPLVVGRHHRRLARSGASGARGRCARAHDGRAAAPSLARDRAGGGRGRRGERRRRRSTSRAPSALLRERGCSRDPHRGGPDDSSGRSSPRELVDELFLTVSPLLAGRALDPAPRPRRGRRAPPANARRRPAPLGASARLAPLPALRAPLVLRFSCR